MPRHASVTALALAFLAVSCGGGGSPMAPPPVPTHDFAVVVFYDENGNGMLDITEGARVPDVTVLVGGRQGRSATVSGEAILTGVPAGTQTVTLQASTLPPRYVAPPAITVTVPQSGQTTIPVTLPIGSNRPNTYLAFGDSITDGEGSSDGDGFRTSLQSRLIGHFGRGTVIKDGLAGTRSNRGEMRLADSLTVRPAYTLIHYGTNDWNDGACKESPPCFTIDSLRSMVQQVKARQGIPVLATLIPTNPAHNAERNGWIALIDALIRTMAQDEGAILADMEPAFLREGDLRQLFTDHVHPSDRGYEIMAVEYFNAITRPEVAAAAAGAVARAAPEDAFPALLKRPGRAPRPVRRGQK